MFWTVCFALAMVACTGDEKQARPHGDDVVVLLPREPEAVDPRQVFDAYGLRVSRLLFASLVTVDAQTIDIVPDLAERVEVVSPTVYRVTLRDGMRFSDGSVLDAADVMATFRSIVDPQMRSRYAKTYARISRMESPDPRTIIFHLDAPHAPFMSDLEVPILRAEDAARSVEAKPIGAGPYRLVTRSPQELTLEANPYWFRGKPKYPHVRMVVVRDDNTRALRMLAGGGDLALATMPSLLVPMFESAARQGNARPFRVESAAGIGTTYVGFHTEAKFVSDVRVRRAISFAIDRAGLVHAKFDGRAELARSFVPPGHWAYDAALPEFPFDPKAARALLDAAGYPDPDGIGPKSRFHLTLRTSTDRSRVSICMAMAAMLHEVGIAVDVQPTETASLLADLNKGRFEMTLLTLPELIEPHVLSWFFGSDRIPGKGAEGANRWRYRSKALDAALERGRSTAVRDERAAAYAEAQRILGTDLPAFPLWHEDVVAVEGERVKGFVTPRDGRFGGLAW